MQGTRRRARRKAWALLALCASLLLPAMPRPARAQAPTSDAARASEAKKLFAKGSELYVARRYAEALEALKSSHDLVPSPNSGLLIARCLRELGQTVEAVQKFASVEADARHRVDGGEAKYARTADSAAAEGAATRATLGTIHLHIEGADTSTRLEVDGTPVTVPEDGNVLVLHVPGEATISVRPASGLEQKQTVTVRAGSEVKMEFTPIDAANPPSPLLPKTGALARPGPPGLPPSGSDEDVGPHVDLSASSNWATPAALVSGGVAVVGFGLFTGFGLASQDEYRKVEVACQSHPCLSSAQGDAATGKRNQLIANVSVAVGSVAAAATLTFAIVALTSGHAKAAGAAPLHLRLGTTSIAVGGTFE